MAPLTLQAKTQTMGRTGPTKKESRKIIKIKSGPFFAPPY
jgi:hypothetical protein